jgi:hypothetical protein
LEAVALGAGGDDPVAININLESTLAVGESGLRNAVEVTGDRRGGQSAGEEGGMGPAGGD